MAAIQLSAEEIADLKNKSKRLFGQENLLGVAVVMLRTNKTVTRTELCSAVGISNQSSLRPSVDRLIDCGFIEEQLQGTNLGSNQRPLQRGDVDSAFWQLVEELWRGRGQGRLI